MFTEAEVDFIPGRPKGCEFDVKLVQDGYYAGNGKAFADIDSAIEFAQDSAEKTKVSERANTVAKTWPPNDTTLITRAEWTH